MTRQIPAALVLAAGESRRFWPLSSTRHKSLFRLGGMSLLERTVTSLVNVGVKQIVVVESPRSLYSNSSAAVLPSDCLPTRYGDSRVTFVKQPAPVGQGDVILRSAAALGDYFFVVQPENIEAGAIAIELLQTASNQDIVVVAGQERADFSLYAVLEYRGQQLISITEKPASASSARPLCSMGMYLFHNTFIDYVGALEPNPMSIIYAIDQVAHMGKASVTKSSHKFLPLKYPGHLWAYARFLGVTSDSAVAANGSTKNSRYCRSDQNKFIASEGCTIGDHAVLNNAILAPGVVIGSGTEILGGTQWNDLDAVVIGENATIGASVKILPGVRIGNGATVGSGLRIDADVADMTTIEG